MSLLTCTKPSDAELKRRMIDPGAGPDSLTHEDDAVVALQGRVLLTADQIGVAWRAEVFGRYLVVLDALRDPFIHVIDRDSGEIIESFGRNGGGPGEYVGPTSIARDFSNQSAFWIFDLNQRRFTKNALDANGRLQPGPPPSLAILGTASSAEPIWVSATSLLMHNWRDSTLLSLYDSRGNLRKTTGAIPIIARKDIDRLTFNRSYESRACDNNGNGKVALATRYAGHIFIYDANGDFIASGKSPFTFEPHIDTHPLTHKKDFVNGSPNVRQGYLTCTANAHHIFALFSGRLQRPEIRKRASYGHYVHVYDWDGDLVTILKLDVDALGIAVDETGKRLYSVQDDPNSPVRVFDLPDIGTNVISVNRPRKNETNN
jgi:hypothetical protein